MSQLLLVLFSLVMPFTSSNEVGNPYTVGDKVEDFNLKSVDGNMYSLSSAKNVKGYIVVFTCNHCPYAVMYEDRMNDLNAFEKKMTSLYLRSILTILTKYQKMALLRCK